MRTGRLLVVALSAYSLVAGSAQPQESPRLRPVAVSRSGATVRAIVALPALLSGGTLPRDAVEVSINGEPRAARVSRLPQSTAELTIMLDVPVNDAARLSAVQGAVADFLFQLPADVPVAVVAAGTASPAMPAVDRAKTLAALRDMRPQSEQPIGPAISALLSTVAARGIERSVVIIVSARSTNLDGEVAETPLGRPLVYSVGVPAGADGVAAATALRTGGTLGHWRTTPDLVAALDLVMADIAGQYLVEFESTQAGQLDIAANYAGANAIGRFILPPADRVPSASTAPPAPASASAPAAEPGVAAPLPSAAVSAVPPADLAATPPAPAAAPAADRSTSATGAGWWIAVLLAAVVAIGTGIYLRARPVRPQSSATPHSRPGELIDDVPIGPREAPAPAVVDAIDAVPGVIDLTDRTLAARRRRRDADDAVNADDADDARLIDDVPAPSRAGSDEPQP